MTAGPGSFGRGRSPGRKAMSDSGNRIVRLLAALSLTFTLLVFGAPAATAEEYAALDGVKGLKTVFDFGQGSPEKAVVVFQAIRDVYREKSVTSLATPPATVIVFRSGAVKLLSTADRNEKVAEMIRQFKKDGVRMEVCMFAVKVLGVDPDTLMPEIEKVPNGFVSVSGYQAQGYSVISVQ